jgi:hypothetical protein
MRHSPTRHHLSRECLDVCRFKLTAVLARLTTGSLTVGVPAVRPVAEAPVCDSTIELALFCGRYLAANRTEWTSFLIRQVSEALWRIDDGNYGLCLQCGEPISVKRLTALPWVELCAGCQEGKSKYGAA